MMFLRNMDEDTIKIDVVRRNKKLVNCGGCSKKMFFCEDEKVRVNSGRCS